MKKASAITIPHGADTVLLHACCAPCSSAIVEWLIQHGVTPVIFYYNPNIFPREEYEIRKNESKRHAESLGIRWIDGNYDHDKWLMQVRGLEAEPERGSRCLQCFRLRLTATALQAAHLGIKHFTTTLASSRWKSLEQINEAGLIAQEAVPNTEFWAQNWRKGGLYERRNALLKEYNFYNQLYCGCEFSMRASAALQNRSLCKEPENGSGTNERTDTLTANKDTATEEGAVAKENTCRKTRAGKA